MFSQSSWAIAFRNRQTNTWSSPCHSHSCQTCANTDSPEWIFKEIHAEVSPVDSLQTKMQIWKCNHVTFLTVSVDSSIKISVMYVGACLFCYAYYVCSAYFMCISWFLAFFIEGKYLPQIEFQEVPLTDAIFHHSNGQCGTSQTISSAAAGSTLMTQTGLRRGWILFS